MSCPRCQELRAAALQVAGAWDTLKMGEPEAAACVCDTAPTLAEACEELSEEVQRDDDAPQG